MIIKKIYELYPHLFNDDSLFLKLGQEKLPFKLTLNTFELNLV